MTTHQLWTSYATIVRKEVDRFLRIWTQTLVPPLITQTLYFVIFGKFIGAQVEAIHGFTYMQYIVPGLVMMAIIMNSFMHTVSSFYLAKFQRTIEEIVVSPTPYSVVIAGFVTGGMLRGLMTGALVMGISLFFTHTAIAHVGAMILFAVLTSLFFSLLGLVNGVYATSFDGMMIIPNFVLTPLTYLGGIFYSISMLPHIWQTLSQFNPILYMINGFRYGLLGISDVSVFHAASILILMSVAMSAFAWWLFQSGRGLKA